MADPLSIAAGLIGVAGAAVSISSGLFNFGESVAKAGKHIYQLATELAHFSIAPKALARILQDNYHHFKPELLADTDVYRQDCDLVLRDIKHDFGDLNPQGISLLDRAKWFFKEEKVNLQRARLERAKASLTLMIGVLNLAACLRRDIPIPDRQDDEIRQQYESTKVFVVVADRAYREVPELQVGLKAQQLEDSGSSHTLARATDTPVDLANTAISGLLLGSSGSSSVISESQRDTPREETDHSSVVQNVGHNSPVASKQSKKLEPARVVKKLLLSWTTVDDLSALPAAPADELPSTGEISKDTPLPKDDSAAPNTSSTPKIAAEKAASSSNPTEGPKSPAENKSDTDTSGKDSQNQTLPQGWEERTMNTGRKYYIDHNTKTTSWDPPVMAHDGKFIASKPGQFRRIADPAKGIHLYLWTPPLYSALSKASPPVEIAYMESPAWNSSDSSFEEYFRPRKMLCFWISFQNFNRYFAVSYESARTWTDHEYEMTEGTSNKQGVSNIICAACFNVLDMGRYHLVQDLMKESRSSTETDLLYKQVYSAKTIYAEIMARSYKVYRIRKPGQHLEAAPPVDGRERILKDEWTQEILKIGDNTHDSCIQIALNIAEDGK